MQNFEYSNFEYVWRLKHRKKLGVTRCFPLEIFWNELCLKANLHWESARSSRVRFFVCFIASGNSAACTALHGNSWHGKKKVTPRSVSHGKYVCSDRCASFKCSVSRSTVTVVSVEGRHKLGGTAVNSDFIRQVIPETFEFKEYTVFQLTASRFVAYSLDIQA